MTDTSPFHGSQDLNSSTPSLSDLEQISGSHVIRTDLDGIITAASPGIKEDFQWPIDDMVGHRVIEFVADIDRPTLSAILQDAIPGLTAQIDFRFLNRRMASIPVRARITALTDKQSLLISFHEEETPLHTSPVVEKATARREEQQMKLGEKQGRLKRLSTFVFGMFTPTPSSMPTAISTQRWGMVAVAISTVLLIGSALSIFVEPVGSIDRAHSLLISYGMIPVFALIAVSVLLSLPRRKLWNIASATTAAVAAFIVIAEWLSLTRGSTGSLTIVGNVSVEPASTTEYALALIFAIGAFGLGINHFIGNLLSSTAQVIGWVAIIPTTLMYAYHRADQTLLFGTGNHEVTLSFAVASGVTLLALGAARPERPLLASPFMGKGFGTVPVAILIAVFVPATLLGILTRHPNMQMTITLATSVMIVSLCLMFVVMIYLESQRFRADLRQKIALEDQARQYRLYTDNMADALIYVRDGRVEWLSRSTERLFGWRLKSDRNLRLTDRVHPADRDDLAAALSEYNTGEASTVIVARVDNNKHEYVWTQQTIRPYLDTNGVPSGHIIVLRDISDQIAAEEQAHNAAIVMEHRAKHDTLTGLLNRTEALATLTTLCALATDDHPVTVLIGDLDNFHSINDGVSHEAGDEVLIQVASLLDENIPISGLTARAGGDEFIIVLPGYGTEAATRLATNLVHEVRSHEFTASGFGIPISMTIGFATATSATTAGALISCADTALGRGKVAAPGTVTAFTAEMQQDITERIRMAQALKQSIIQREFYAWGQPIREMSSGRVVGYEALARWIPEGSDPIPAKDWVEIAEVHGLMSAIGDIVIEDAIRAISGLPDTIYITVNASGRQLLKPQFVTHLLEQVAIHNVDPTRLVVEVTEATLIDTTSTKAIGDALEELRGHGIRVYLDDFGTGFSAISHLSDFPVVGLKLDQSFTRAISRERDYELAAGVAALAKSLNLTRVAEGVETEEQAAALMRAGWELGQGWLYGKPAPFPSPNRMLQFRDGQAPPLATILPPADSPDTAIDDDPNSEN